MADSPARAMAHFFKESQGGILYLDSTPDPAILAAGTSGNYLKTQGAGANPTWADFVISEQSVADMSSGSPTVHTFTGLAGAKRIVVNIDAQSSSGTDNLEVVIGDAGGLETTGYTGISLNPANNAPASAITDAWQLNSQAPGAAEDCIIGFQMDLLDAASFTWGIIGIYQGGTTKAGNFMGRKSLSAALTQWQLQFSGSNTFDGGSLYMVAYGQ